MGTSVENQVLQAAVVFHSLTGPEFQDATSGARDRATNNVTPGWLLSPRKDIIKYYMPRACGTSRPDTRQFFAATVASHDESGKREIVGLLEVDFEGGTKDVLGIKYVSVKASHRKQGIAFALYGMLIEHLKFHNFKLYRTPPGLKTPEEFTEAITRLLQASGVSWHSNRSVALT